MYDLEGAVKDAIKACKRLQKQHRDVEDRRVIATALAYAERALEDKNEAEMLVAFEMVERIKSAKRPFDLISKK